MTLVGMASLAQAACVGGGDIKGGFTITIAGKLVAGGTEALAGVVTSDGKCGLTGKAYGNVNGVAITSSLSGTYNVNSDLTGTMTIALGGKPANTFHIDVVGKKKEVVGVENDGTATSDIYLRAQVLKTFSNATLNGNYSYVCSNPGTGPCGISEWHFDGLGHGTYTDNYYGANGTLSSVSGSATYSVASDGSYTITINTGANTYLSGGGIGSNGTNVPLANVSQNGSGAAASPIIFDAPKQ